MLTRFKNNLRDWLDYLRLPREAKAERREDRRRGLGTDPGLEEATKTSIGWILRAQQESASNDKGMARFYSLLTGWSVSYAASTGHTIPVLLEARDFGCRQGPEAAQRMLDWLVDTQRQNGAYDGGLTGSADNVATSFSTASVLIGLAAGARHFGEPYVAAMTSAADWLRDDQDDDGCWRRHQSPYNETRDNTFDTHIAWALIEAHRQTPDKGYDEAARKNIAWALNYQQENGWLDRCCSSNPSQPLSHTLGFAFRGIVEAFREFGDDRLRAASTAMADGFLQAFDVDCGLLPGRIDQHWRGQVAWSCPTANAQVSIAWLLLYESTGDKRYWNAAIAANRTLRRILRHHPNPNISGGCKGSFPVDGGYARYRFITPRFCIEAYDLERKLA